jgi:hypothetical protein
MIKIFRWHHTHFQPPVEVDSSVLSEISFGVDKNQNYITIDNTQISIGDNINIKEEVRFLVGYHALQRNVYLAMANTLLKDTWILAQIKNRFDQELYITVIPSILNRINVLGESIAMAMTQSARVICTADSIFDVNFTLQIEEWESDPHIEINFTELSEFMCSSEDKDYSE